MDSIVKLLNISKLFSNIPENEILKFISNFSYELTNASKGVCVISKDEDVNYIALVIKGTLGIYADNMYGGHTLIGIADKDYLFGFIASFFNQNRSITSLYAREKCQIIKFHISEQTTRDEFLKKTHSGIVLNIFDILTNHIRRDFAQIYIVSAKTVRLKLVRYILNLYSQENTLLLNLKFNRTELANYLGVYRTSLHHELKKMCDEKMIKIERNFVYIENLNKMIECESNS